MDVVPMNENISEAHINAKNKAFEEILELKTKYIDHNIQTYVQTLNNVIIFIDLLSMLCVY
jgi:hypothetical protein